MAPIQVIYSGMLKLLQGLNPTKASGLVAVAGTFSGDPVNEVSAIISPSRTDTKPIISPASKLSPKTLKNTEMTTTNPNTKP